MFIQVFRKTDGMPQLIQGMTVYETLEIEYDYDRDLYTEVMPPNGLYNPIHFDGEQWVGTSKEEWEENRPEKEPHIPKASEIMLAQAQMQVTKTANQLIKTQHEQAETLTELTKKEQRLKEIEQQQANTLLEIAKLKGEK
ncbi:hypothetical protein M4L39_06930 [Staphylococcus equorum]|uniref:hypothetical protein n=1 Tax=Staphylococcus equorum TaxID=246432 RepID=UPI002407BA58|nr:hypothetical protein [Staphylococcus equorum]MDG0843172.1 hypothetical protein [Staphylococcus equorum]